MLRQFAAPVLASMLVCSCAQQPAPERRHSADVQLRSEIQTIESRVPRNATLQSLLRDNELPGDLVDAAVDAARAVFDPRHLRADNPYRLVRTIDGLLREFEYQIDADRFLRIASRDGSEPPTLEAEVLPYEKASTVVAIGGRIDADHPSVIAAMDETGENVQLAMSLAGIFAGQIDFESDLQEGDSFEVLFEKSTRDGEFAGYGEILSARFTADGREHRAFRWVDPSNGKAAYYDSEGRSLRRFFLRTPLLFAPRVTSGFSRSRLHPVYRAYRAHLGIDYGAPVGSQVVAVASGVVVSTGWSGGGGNMIRLRHPNGYESYYLHLSAFARGVRPGTRVTQGQVIGRVGATGVATGPHLDFRIRRNGAFVNPLVEQKRLPPGEPIPASALASFRASRDAMLRQLSTTLLADTRPAVPVHASETR